jgi:hypothetical protein
MDDLLRAAGVARSQWFANGHTARNHVARERLFSLPHSRRRSSRPRMAAVFMLARFVTAFRTEQWRVADANAGFGMPVSNGTLLKGGHVGPYRRASIVTAGVASRRKRGDAPDVA